MNMKSSSDRVHFNFRGFLFGIIFPLLSSIILYVADVDPRIAGIPLVVTHTIWQGSYRRMQLFLPADMFYQRPRSRVIVERAVVAVYYAALILAYMILY